MRHQSQNCETSLQVGDGALRKPFFVLPESFDPGEFLPSSELLRRSDDARYFMSLILTKLARHDVDERGLVRLHANHLASIMYRPTYCRVLNALRIGGAVERFPYVVGERSFGFRLAARFVSDNHVRIPATDSRLIARLAAFHAEAEVERQARMKPVHHELALRQRRLRIDGRAARRKLGELPRECNPFDVQGILIAGIENHEFHANVGRFGRLSNNVTSLKRELRSSLHVDGEPLGNVDLSCAQPALLGKLIRDTQQAGQSNRQQAATKQSKYDYSRTLRFGKESGDFERYLALVQTGQFYDYMVEKLRGTGIGRNEFKVKFLSDILAKKGRYPSVVEDTFREWFPTVYRFVRHVNRQGSEHANLIRRLQQEESCFVIETVAADLALRHPSMFLLTLHDAIFTTAGDVPKVEQAFQRGFERIGFGMRVKVES